MGRPEETKANLFDFVKTKNKAKPVKQARAGSTTYNVPPKVSRAVPIVAPSLHQQLSVPQNQSDPAAKSTSFPPVNNHAASSLVRAPGTSPPTAITPRNAFNPLKALPPPQPKTIFGRQQSPPPPSTPPCPPINVKYSELDVYAKTYIPIHLRAINDSYADVWPSVLLPATDFAQYIASFAGNSYLSPVEFFPIPLLINPVIRIQTPSKEIDLEDYVTYLSERLHNELCAQAAELKDLTLFDATRSSVSVLSTNNISFNVPGIRENNPRVDLGDVVLIRTWTCPPHRNLAENARNWYISGGPQSNRLAPGFSGVEFRAVVWGIQRASETLILRIDGFPTPTAAGVRINISFIVQDHKCTPLYRAITCSGKTTKDEPPTRASKWRKSMLFPTVEDTMTQKTLSKGKFNNPWFDMQLNFEQQKAVDAILTNEYGVMPFMISGPPGTGKTKTLVEATLQLLNQDDQGCSPHLLVCAPSDSAADTITTRLKAHLSPATLFRLNGWARSFAEVPDHLTMYCFTENELFTLPDFKKMMTLKVVVTTCRDAEMLVNARLTNSDLATLTSQLLTITPNAIAGPYLLHWTALLMDEAAQATEPEALIPISVVKPPVIMKALSGKEQESILMPQIVMAGDAHQLGPRLAFKGPNGLDVSMFQRIFEREVYSDHPLSRTKGSKPLTAAMLPLPRPAFVNLVRNYRSHPAILTTSSVLFYNDTLIPEITQVSDGVKKWEGWNKKNQLPILFRQCTSPDAVESLTAGNGNGAGALVNQGEAQIALEMIKSLTRKSPGTTTGEESKGIIASQIMIMSPFRAQVALLRNMCRDAGFRAVNIGPLDAFQGLESKVVIICTTRTRLDAKDQARFVKEDISLGLGLVGNRRKFNVALTRAKEGLIVIGDPQALTCTKDVNWAAFLAFCKRNQCIQFEEGFNSNNLQIESETPVGRLERALMYSSEARKRDIERAEFKGGFGYADANGKGKGKGVNLKGNLPGADEDMWTAGTQMVEREEEARSEYADEEEDPLELIRELEEVNLRSQAQRQRQGQLISLTPEKKTGDGGGFDRDLEKELENEPCATQ